jgi:hypothetical protein
MPSRRRFEPSTKRDPIHEAVAGRAYEIFLERGGQHGNDLDDWLQAEREMLGMVSRRTWAVATKVPAMTPAAGGDTAVGPFGLPAERATAIEDKRKISGQA